MGPSNASSLAIKPFIKEKQVNRDLVLPGWEKQAGTGVVVGLDFRAGEGAQARVARPEEH